VSFGNQVPMREELLERAYPLLDKHRGRVTVLSYDVQFQTILVQGGVSYSWVLIVISAGALLGPDNYLSYTYTLGQNAQLPDDRTLEAAVKELFTKLSIMMTRQLQTQTPEALGGPANN
jgi:hypothetical protein